MKFYLRRVIHLEACSICSQRCWDLCEQPHPSRERGGEAAHCPQWGCGWFICFVYLLHSVFIQHLIIREEDARRVRDVSCQKGPVHKLLMLQSPVAGYNKHLKPNPGISIPRITVAHNGFCQNVNSVGMCYIENVKVNAKKLPQDFVQWYHELSIKD